MSSCRNQLHWRQRKQCVHDHPHRALNDWLFDPASLTARLIKHCHGQFQVTLLSLRMGLPRLDEALALHMRSRNQALLRQVLLCCGEVPLVYARTVIPLTSLRGPVRGLTRLGNKPLGAVLFANRSMRRSVIEVTKLMPSHPGYADLKYADKKTVWGRRSVFHLHQQPLLVSEFFLPGLERNKVY